MSRGTKCLHSTSVFVCLAAATALGIDPVGWRQDGTGHFPDTRPPSEWGPEKNVLWKTELPKWSNASPTIVGDKVFVCAEPSTLICVAADTGEILWQRTNEEEDVLSPEEWAKVQAAAPTIKALRQDKNQLGKRRSSLRRKLKETPDDETLKQEDKELAARLQTVSKQLAELAPLAQPVTHSVNGYSSPTPASDDRAVYVLFGNGVAAAYDLDGNRLWGRVVEKPTQGWGHSASPLLAGGKLILAVRSLMALAPDSGETLWQIPCAARWGSPVRAQLNGQAVVVTPDGDIVKTTDGTVLTRKAAKLDYCSPVVHDGLVYFIQNRGAAVQLPETADATAPATKLWTTEPKKERYYASPVVHDGLIYAVTRYGDWSVIDAGTGELVYTRKLDFGNKKTEFYSSITLAGKHIYVSDDKGTTAVLEPGREYKEVARNALEEYRSTPLFHGTRIYIRARRHLYCIGT